jgi:cytochrome c-type biogenesis protein CcmH
MIRSMVDGLEARLQTDGDDLEGWQRLIRSRSVLGEMDKAKAALAKARERFKDKPEAIAALAGLAKEVGLE